MPHPDPAVEQSRHFPKLSLGGLFFFGMYLREAIQRFYGGGVSFRAYVKKAGDGRSHRALIKMVDRIEYQSQKLLMEREYAVGPERVKYRARDLADARDTGARRMGEVTRYGEAWCELIEHMADLYDLAIETETDVDIVPMIRLHRRLLQRQLKRRARPLEQTQRSPESFDYL